MPIAVCVDWSGARRAREGLSHVGDESSTSEVARIGEGTFAFLRAPADSSITFGDLDGLSLVLDARIDNARELGHMLERPADEPVARLILHGYRKWHDAVVDHVIGDFAFVLWDSARRRVLAARDPFGVRPLFYTARDRRIWFASRVFDLRRTLVGTPVLDDERIVEHVLWRYRSTSSTFFRDIRELPAGHVLESTSEGERVTRYWFPPAPRTDLETRGRDEVFEELRAHFRTAVQRRSRSAHPVVVHVSGGLDSSSIAMVANELGPTAGGPPAFVGTADVFPGLECDESTFIDAVARAVRYPIERRDGRESSPVDLSDPAFEGPGARMVTTWGTDGDIEAAKIHGARVILSGLGGDDLMMATGFTRDLIAQRRWRQAWHSLSAEGVNWKAARRMKRIALQFLPPKVLAVRAQRIAEVPDWLAPRFRDLARDIIASGEVGVGHVDSKLGSLVRRNAWSRLNAAYNRRAIDAMQNKASLTGMEYRYPFFDRDLVTFVLSLPPHCLPGPMPYARIHRDAFRPILPPEIANRTWKAEMSSSLRHRSERARPAIEALFSDAQWLCEPYVTKDAARRLLRAVTDRPGAARPSPMDRWRLWNIVSLEAWMRRLLRYGTHQKFGWPDLQETRR